MTTHQIAQLFLALAAIIVLARGFGALARRLGQPPVIGELTAGILVGPTLLPPQLTAMIFPDSIATALAALANVALVLFMFCVGLELDPALMRGHGRVAVSVSIASITLPFVLSVPLAYWLATNHEVSHDASFVLFLGAAMSVTAFPVLARILTDRGMHRIGLGGLALACAAFDDVMAWSLLALVVAVGGFAAGGEWQVLLAIPYVLVMVLAVRPLLRRWLTQDGRPRKLTSGVLAGVLFGVLVSCFATEWMGIHYIFGAFLFGAVMPSEGFAGLRAAVVERIEPVNMMFLLPVFFILSGMRVNLSTLDMQNVLELGLILVVAVVGKFVGAFTSSRWLGFDNRKSAALATLMNTRGLTEIVFVTVGLQYAIIDHELFSLMVVMALVTTAMSGPLLNWIYPRRMVARDRVEQRRSARQFVQAA